MTENEKGEQDSWSAVQSAPNESEAALVVGFLESHGIPARVMDVSFHQYPTSTEDLSEVEIAVPTDRLDEARTALDQREKAFASSPEGDATVMTDEGPAEIDPNAPEGE